MKWIERVFDSYVPSELHPELIERLRGTPARAGERTLSLPPDVLVRREGESWSIQEHVGHLIDTEALFAARLKDYEAGEETLYPADTSGRMTYDACHNENTLATILERLERVRKEFVRRLEGWDSALFARTALHPRLKTPMSAAHMLYFQAEHDDHHLARITELIRRFRPAGGGAHHGDDAR
jgi:uncharacterized damage-inducible protein DinB